MSKGYRNGAFAVGLISGVGLTLNLVLWLDYKAKYETEQASQPYDDPNSSEISQFWDWLIGTFVSPSDTLAQWIMAILTIAAVILLWRTLSSANQTNIAAIKAANAATEANQIMRDEQRPWLKIGFTEDAGVSFLEHKVAVDFGYKIQNVGKFPAKISPINVIGFVCRYPLNPAWAYDEAMIRADVRLHKNADDTKTEVIFPNDRLSQEIRCWTVIDGIDLNNQVLPDVEPPPAENTLCVIVAVCVYYDLGGKEGKAVSARFLVNGGDGLMFKRGEPAPNVRVDSRFNYEIIE